MSVHTSRIEESHDAAVFVAASDLVMHDTVVRDTEPCLTNGLFGDGLLLVALPEPANAWLSGSLIEGGPRVGVALFGSTANIGTTALQCNAIHINSQAHLGWTGDTVDLGDNGCGCAQLEEICTVKSAGLEPPEPIGTNE